jgi:preprotein translocase subunit SecG
MMTFLLVIHTMLCILLAFIILMQAGRGGGLTETFSGAENVFGAKTNTMLVRATTIIATIFIFTSIALAYLSSRKEQSLMRNVKAPAKMNIEIPITPDTKDVQNNLPKASPGAPLQTQATQPVSSQPAAPQPAQ